MDIFDLFKDESLAYYSYLVLSYKFPEENTEYEDFCLNLFQDRRMFFLNYVLKNIEAFYFYQRYPELEEELVNSEYLMMNFILKKWDLSCFKFKSGRPIWLSLAIDSNLDNLKLLKNLQVFPEDYSEISNFCLYHKNFKIYRLFCEMYQLENLELDLEIENLQIKD